MLSDVRIICHKFNWEKLNETILACFLLLYRLFKGIATVNGGNRNCSGFWRENGLSGRVKMISISGRRS